MTLDERLSAALARRGNQKLGTFIADALGLSCGPHHARAACHRYAGDEQIVALLERYEPRPPAQRPLRTHEKEMPVPWLSRNLYVKTPCSCLHDNVEHYRGGQCLARSRESMCPCGVFDALRLTQLAVG